MSHPVDPAAPFDAAKGWPLCECGHSISLHEPGGGCRRVECLYGSRRCGGYRPSEPIKRDSLAELGEMVRQHSQYAMIGDETSRRINAAIACSIVTQMVPQWAGYKPKEGGA